MSFRAVKAVKKTKKRNVFCTGGIGGSKYTEFEIGKTYKQEGEIELCQNGFHYYKTKNLVFGLTLFDNNTCFLEVEILGDFKEDTEKCITNELRIIRYIPKKEWKSTIRRNQNSGNSNSGYQNSGNRNSGDRNSGDWNSGDRNSGNWNSGDSNSGNRNSGYSNSGDRNSGNWNSGDSNSGYSNSGDRNSGDRNSGYSNSGDRNSGNWNSGDSNSGDWNSGNWNSCNNESGFFNSQQTKTIRIFNQPCSRQVWENCQKPNFIFFNLLKDKTYKESFQESWDNTTEEDRKLVEKLPNFNWKVFTEISGIKKPKDWK